LSRLAQWPRSAPEAFTRTQAPVARVGAEGSSSLALHEPSEQRRITFLSIDLWQNLEGIVCKPKTSPYPFTWIKVKNPAYTQAADRGECFDRIRK
jgi:hypothetical protein